MLAKDQESSCLPHIGRAGIRKDLRIVYSAVVNGGHVRVPASEVPRIVSGRVLLSQEALALSLLDDLPRGRGAVRC